MGEVEYRRMILKSICEIVPPYFTADLSYVQGGERIFQQMINKFNQLPCTGTRLASDTRILVVYGSTGMGKTTLCKIMCNHFRRMSRVCHIEVGANGLDLLNAQKNVLKQLTGASESLLQSVTDTDQAQDLLVRRINGQRAFLAIDNACTDESSLHMTRKLLRLPFTKESLVMVTACTRQNLLEVVGYDISEKCFHVPNLTEDEAIQIILDRAIPNCNFTSLPHSHQQTMRCCASRCQISCTIYSNSRNCEGAMTKDCYHPSSLIEIGAWLGGNPTNWKHRLECLQNFPKLNDPMSKNYHCTKGLQYVVDHCESSCISSDIQRISSYQFLFAWRNSGRTKEQFSLLSGFDEKDNQKDLNKVEKIPTVINQHACPKTLGGVWKFTKYLLPLLSKMQTSGGVWKFMKCLLPFIKAIK